MNKRKNNLQFRLGIQKKEKDIPLRLNLLNLCNLKKNESRCYWVIKWQSVREFVGY